MVPHVGVGDGELVAGDVGSLSIALALMTMIAVVFWLLEPTKDRPEVD
jgi:hypothetical protein